MTEQEWLTSENPAGMFAHLGKRVSSHKLRCWVDACNALCKYPYEHEGCDIAAADDPPIHLFIHAWADESVANGDLPQATKAALLREIVGNPFRPPTPRCTWCAGDGLDSHEDDERKCTLCKGSGCMPVPKDWLTRDVLALATAIQDEHRFEDMPILADALEDAGCNNVEILNHCRAACPSCKEAAFKTGDSGGPLMGGDVKLGARMTRHLLRNCACRGTRLLQHVRGCWVLDLVRGKQS